MVSDYNESLLAMPGVIEIPNILANGGREEVALLLNYAAISDCADAGKDALDGRPDADRIFHLARLNKMLGVLPLQPQALPQSLVRLVPDLLHARLQTMGMNRRALAVAVGISHVLTASDVPHLIMKGPLQQIALYGNGFVRPCADLDLFVSARQRVRAARLISDSGFQVFESNHALWWVRFLGEQHFQRSLDGAVVDLHHRLQQTGLPGWRQPDQVLTRIAHQTFEDTTLPVMGAGDGCVLLAITIAKALLARQACGGAVCDLRQAIRKMNETQWHEAESIAGAAGQAVTLALACAMAQACFGPSLSPCEQVNSRIRHIVATIGVSGYDDSELRDLTFQPWVMLDKGMRHRKLLWMLNRGQRFRLPGQVLRIALARLANKIGGTPDQT